MLILIVFLTVVLPYRIPFEDQASLAWLIVDETIDLIFLTDVIINFMSTYEDENGRLVVNRCKIASNYLKSWFLVDIISCVPITLI